MRRHVFLTGEKGVGKSTIIDSVVAAQGVAVCGFYTFFEGGRTNPDRTLRVSDARYGRRIEGSRVLVSFKNGIYRKIDGEAFDGYAADLIKPAADTKLIVMDECGDFEKDCVVFRETVINALGSALPVLGVLREGLGTWRDEIRGHPDVRLETVSRENRDVLAAEIAAYLNLTRGW